MVSHPNGLVRGQGFLLIGKTKGFVVADKLDYGTYRGKIEILYGEITTSSSLDTAVSHADKLHKKALKEPRYCDAIRAIIVVEVETKKEILTLVY